MRNPEKPSKPLLALIVICLLLCGGLLPSCSKTSFEPLTVTSEPEEKAGDLFSCGLLAVSKDGKWGYIDKTGNYAIQPKFEYAFNFNPNGIALIIYNNRYGYIDTSGNFLFEPRFNLARAFDENNSARVYINGKWGVINTSGKLIIEPKYDQVWPFSPEGLTAMEVDGKYGFIDENGNEIISPRFTDISNTGKDQVFVKEYGKWGIIDISGEYIVTPQYYSVEQVGENVLVAQKDGKFGLINALGQVLAPFIFASISDDYMKGDFYITNDHPFSDGFIRVEKGGLYNYLDINGNLVSETFYDDVDPDGFSAIGLAAVQMDGKWGYIDTKGNIIIKPQFEYAGAFAANGLAPASSGDHIGYINTKGRFVLKPKYKGFSPFDENGIAYVAKDGPFYYIDSKGKERFSGYERIYHCGHLYRFVKDNYWGFIDINGTVLISAQFFETAGEFSGDGFIIVAKTMEGGLKYGLLNTNLEYAAPLIFDEIQTEFERDPDKMMKYVLY